MQSLFGQLTILTSKRNIETVRLESNDDIFKIMDINELSRIADNFLKDLNIVIMQPIRIVEDRDEKNRLLTHYHEHPLEGGHCGFRRTYAKMKSLFFWKDMSKDLALFIKNCASCQVNKPKRQICEPMVITGTPSRPFESVIIDTIGPFPSTTNRVKYALTIICDFSKYLSIIPIPNKSAETIANVLLNYTLTYGPLSTVRSDMGTEFMNSVFRELTSLLKIEHKNSTAYHHQSIGTCERSHKTLNEYLRAYSSNNPKSWNNFVKFFTYCFNTTPNTAINMYTPFELVFGRKVSPLILKSFKNSEYLSVNDYVKQQKETMSRAYDAAKKYIEDNKLLYKKYYDTRANPLNACVGDKVVLINEVRSKLDPLYTSGFEIKRIEGVNVLIYKDITKKSLYVHKNRIRKI